MTNTYNVEKLERAAAIKKDLQKIVKKFRDAQPEEIDWMGRPYRPEYPKAMMTNQQIKNGTATVNFGSNRDEKSHNNLDTFAASDAFKAFCEKHSIKTGPKEINSDNRVQLRMYF